MNQAFLLWRGITYTYIHKKDHRDKTPEKSQWTISELEERSCFVHGIKNNWNTPQKFVSWGLHFNDQGKVAYLGETASKEPESQTQKWRTYKMLTGTNYGFTRRQYPCYPRV